MGCDIHDYCEIKIGDFWQPVGKVFKDPYSDEKQEHPYGMRNYYLFGMLAGVRNELIPPIDKCRGIPEDTSIAVDDWGHSYSYYTLKELLEYPFYDDMIELEGMVSSLNYAIFKEKGKPDGHCGGVGGHQTHIISNEEMDEYLISPQDFMKKNIKSLLHEQKRYWESYNNDCPAYRGVIKDLELVENGGMPPASFYTKIKWKNSVRECIGKWWFNETLEKMKELSPDGDYSRVRMVFFFDN